MLLQKGMWSSLNQITIFLSHTCTFQLQQVKLDLNSVSIHCSDLQFIPRAASAPSALPAPGFSGKAEEPKYVVIQRNRKVKFRLWRHSKLPSAALETEQ